METRTIGSLKVSVVGLGCNNFGMRIGRKETAAVVDAALDAGINFFDTADIYGGTKSETYLGAALGARRDEIVLATKFGVPYEGHEGGASAAYIRRAVEDSLARLGTDRIDLYQLHVPDEKTPIAETIGALAELVAEGKVREFGCSNFTVAMLEEAAAATPAGERRIRQRAEPVQHLVPRARGRGPRVLRAHRGGVPALLPPGQRTPERQVPGRRAAARGHPPRRHGRTGGQPALARAPRHRGRPRRVGSAPRPRRAGTGLRLAAARTAVASVIAGATRPEQIAANVAGGEWRPGPDVLAEVDVIAPRR